MLNGLGGVLSDSVRTQASFRRSQWICAECVTRSNGLQYHGYRTLANSYRSGYSGGLVMSRSVGNTSLLRTARTYATMSEYRDSRRHGQSY